MLNGAHQLDGWCQDRTSYLVIGAADRRCLVSWQVSRDQDDLGVFEYEDSRALGELRQVSRRLPD